MAVWINPSMEPQPVLVISWITGNLVMGLNGSAAWAAIKKWMKILKPVFAIWTYPIILNTEFPWVIRLIAGKQPSVYAIWPTKHLRKFQRHPRFSNVSETPPCTAVTTMLVANYLSISRSIYNQSDIKKGAGQAPEVRENYVIYTLHSS